MQAEDAKGVKGRTKGFQCFRNELDVPVRRPWQRDTLVGEKREETQKLIKHDLTTWAAKPISRLDAEETFP
jgi:hypothetical protein